MLPLEEIVSALYYVLGAVAKMNAAMWRYRINFLPINLLAIGLMAFGGVTTATNAIESLHNASTPLSMSVTQIHDAARLAQNYVSVTGMDYPIALYEFGSEGGDKDKIATVEKSWTPLIDRESQRMLLVQRRGKISGGDPHEATVTGMLRALEPDVRTKLAAHNDTVQGIPVETRYMLVAGDQPANSMSSALISAVLFTVVALFVLAMANRDTIFQRADLGTPVAKMKSADSIRVSGTGTFVLEQQGGKFVEKRFVGMPSVLAHTEAGSPALFSNIDASSRFMGVKTADRSGIWRLAVDANSVRETQTGYLYWGTARRPAYRFTYTTRGAKRRAVVTADNLETLGAAVALLTTAPPAQRAAPAT
jgi:hypothetical protein